MCYTYCELMTALKVLIVLFILLKTDVGASVLGHFSCYRGYSHWRIIEYNHVLDMQAFPWLGVVQHSYMIEGKPKYVVTTGVLVHPTHAIAGAQEMNNIPRRHLRQNNTKLVLWHNREEKYVMEVRDYYMHPEYPNVTIGTIALLRLTPAANQYGYEIKKIRMNMYLRCDTFCNATNKPREDPVLPMCMKSIRFKQGCTWDSGVAIVDSTNGSDWLLVGITTTRGPGCNETVRALRLEREYEEWMKDMIKSPPQKSEEDVEDEQGIFVKQLTKTKIIMYPSYARFPKGVGQCAEDQRGYNLYRDKMNIITNNYDGRGFFFVTVSDVASFTCAEVKMVETTMKSKTRMWVEHNCHKEIMGTAYGQENPRDYSKTECFMYFKSTAFVEFRFKFSYNASVELTLWGFAEGGRGVPRSPLLAAPSTEAWWPTDDKIHWSDFGPYNAWWYNL